MKNIITESEVLHELGKIKISENENVVSAGLVESIVIDGGNISIIISIQGNYTQNEAEAIAQKVEELIASYSGVTKASVVLTGKLKADGSVRVEHKSNPKGGVVPPTPKSIDGIKKIILIASGKGGVGKSTISVNFAVTLAEKGLKVGLVDADIYGPSVAKMMGLQGEPEVRNNKMVPPVAHGVKCMSMGLILKENVPVVWRGPMVTKALQQLMYGADWGNLDVLVVDLPPGTGDIHLSIAQNFKTDGVIMVSTPQEVALLDVKKALSMFEKVNIPIIGLVENMSYFIDEKSGNRTDIFGKSAVKEFCKNNNYKLLAELPLNAQVAVNADIGMPAVLLDAGIKFEFSKIAEAL
jgi:ATP-binding protein involved in chromosome partitioning